MNGTINNTYSTYSESANKAFKSLNGSVSVIENQYPPNSNLAFLNGTKTVVFENNEDYKRYEEAENNYNILVAETVDKLLRASGYGEPECRACSTQKPVLNAPLEKRIIALQIATMLLGCSPKEKLITAILNSPTTKVTKKEIPILH
jgi:hypothetical protein